MYQQRAEVLWNRQLSPVYYRMGLMCATHYSQAKPGQFVMLGLLEQKDPLLRRPFSIHSLITPDGIIEGIEILYKVVGKATAKLALQKPGDVVDVLGPLGTGFIVPLRARRIYIAAGGIGVAPLVFLVSYLSQKPIDLTDCQVFLGARTKEDLLCRDEFSKLGIAVHTTTDDGSAGDQCLVTHPLEAAMDQHHPDIIFACGPMDMLACVVGIAEKKGVPCQVSIETMMACGIGACLGCAVEGRTQSSTFLHACMDGPVFDANLLKF
ncbi:MAG: dihydroorotate dehydrogenase electron transfer subunit [Desulfobacterales bacterium]|jgi:dihydroorotate dehydrogenase electron transfer subunit